MPHLIAPDGSSLKKKKEFKINYSNSYLQVKSTRGRISSICHFHIPHNTPCLPPKILHNLCFPFLLGITVIPRETEDNAYAKFLGGKLGVLWGMWKWRINK